MIFPWNVATHFFWITLHNVIDVLQYAGIYPHPRSSGSHRLSI
jgi:hypothetical protein